MSAGAGRKFRPPTRLERLTAWWHRWSPDLLAAAGAALAIGTVYGFLLLVAATPTR